jgi:hypothetical protein
MRCFVTYSTSDVTQMLKLRLSQADHVALVGKGRIIHSFVGDFEGKRPVKRPGHKGRIILQ